jgi:hypothetical protein
MGRQNIIKGADFSGLNLGNVSRYQTYVDNAGIVLDNEKAAAKVVHDSLVDAGIMAKADFCYLFLGSSAAAHKFNLKKPFDNDASHRLTFDNDVSGAHTTAGYIPSSTTFRLADTHYNPPADLTQFFLGVCNGTSENVSGDHILAGCYTGATGQGCVVSVARSQNSKTYSCIQRDFVMNEADAGYDRAKTGLLLANRTGVDAHKLWDNGVVIANETDLRQVTVLSGGSIHTLKIGGYSTGTNIKQLYSDATINFAIGGKVALTDQQCIDLDAIVTMFNSAVR